MSPTAKALKSLNFKTTVSERISCVDLRRRRKATEKRLQKQKDVKLKRFNALPAKERNEINDAFEKFDLDKSGGLDRDEVVQCLKEFGLSGMTGEETRELIEICSDATADDQFPVAIWVPEPEVAEVAVGLVDLALTVIPRVRHKLQEMRSQTLLRHFRLYDVEQAGHISIAQCHKLSQELGIDICIFDECFQAQEQGNQDDSDEDQLDQLQHRGAPPTTIHFETFQGVVFAAREKATREHRQEERQIQKDTCLAEETFQEFREDLVTLHQLFIRFDADDSGYLDKEEVTYLLKDFGLLPNDAKERQMVFQIMDACDEDESGEFCFSEFLWLVHQLRIFYLARDKEELLDTFEHCDKDGSGELSIAELSGLLCTLGLVPRTRREQEELAHLIHLVDSDGSGLIDFGEFQVLCQLIKEKMSRLRYEQDMEKAKQMGFSIQEMHDLRYAFDRLDTSCNGSIDKNEAKVGVNLTKLPVTMEAFEECFRSLDADKSGELEFMEFAELMRMLRNREGLFYGEKDGLAWDEDKRR